MNRKSSNNQESGYSKGIQFCVTSWWKGREQKIQYEKGEIAWGQNILAFTLIYVSLLFLPLMESSLMRYEDEHNWLTNCLPFRNDTKSH